MRPTHLAQVGLDLEHERPNLPFAVRPDGAEDPRPDIVAAAFGPGLTATALLLEKI